MQPIVTDRPYHFVPPHRGHVWPGLLKLLVPGNLRRSSGVTDVEFRDVEKLTGPIDAGHGVLITPNHCRMADPLVMQMLSRRIGRHFFTMASSHLFYGSKLRAWLIRRNGGFSVYREGVDREAVQEAIRILGEAERPLVIFPEGSLSHANDRLSALMPGIALISRGAARKREKRSENDDGAPVVVVPVAIKYLFRGDIHSEIEPMLDEIEACLSWRKQRHLSLLERIFKLGHALLTLKELEFTGEMGDGDFSTRLNRLVDHLLVPLEEEWLDGAQRATPSSSVVSRVKELRKAVLPEMIDGGLGEDERTRRWQMLEDMHLAQQLSLYPPDYVRSMPTVDRLLETVDRFLENLTGHERPHPPIRAVVRVGEALRVDSRRLQGPRDDSLLTGIEEQVQTMLDALSTESAMYESASGGR